MNITTRTTIVSNVQLDDNIQIWLLEEEEFKSAPENWKCQRRNNVFRQSISDPRSRNVLKVRLATVDSRNIGTTRRLELAERSAGRPADLLLGRVVQSTVALCRAEPCISTVILYWMCSGTRSQCRLTKASVLWSERLSWKISRAPAFNTDCRRRRRQAGMPTYVPVRCCHSRAETVYQPDNQHL